MKPSKTFRLDKVELRMGATYYVTGACAIYIDDALHCVTHPNPYSENKPMCEIPAGMMKKRNAEIISTLETVREVVQ